MKKEGILKTALELISGDREKTHGNAAEQLADTAALWTAQFIDLDDRDEHFCGGEVAIAMALMKCSRMHHGEFNIDDYVDAIGYLAIAGELFSEGVSKKAGK